MALLLRNGMKPEQQKPSNTSLNLHVSLKRFSRQLLDCRTDRLNQTMKMANY